MFAWGLLLLTSCEKAFDYSPYVIDFDDDNKDVNARNIARLSSNTNSDNIIRIALTGDSHRFYDELEDFVGAVNNRNKTQSIDMVIHVGDLTDFGLPQQYLWGNEKLLKLNMPYMMVIGNHDLVSNGGDAYQTMFGLYNFTFIFDSIKFVFINTNSLEFDMNGQVPDVSWLDAQLKPAGDFRKAVVIFHVAPWHNEFDPDLTTPFTQTLARYHNVLFAAHGHMHDFAVLQPYNDSVTYVNVYSTEHRKYNVIEIKNDTIEVQTYEF